MSLRPETERKILQCVNEVLETLGKSEAQAFSSYLEKNLGLREEEIPRKPELFSKGLSLVFGEQAGEVLETAIVQKLLASLDLDLKIDLTLVGAIVVIKAEQERELGGIRKGLS